MTARIDNASQKKCGYAKGHVPEYVGWHVDWKDFAARPIFRSAVAKLAYRMTLPVHGSPSPSE